MLNDLYDTTITRLKIHAPAHLQDSVHRELQQADWPDAGSEQIVFVRRLTAKAPCREIGRILLNEASHQIHHSNDRENVIRFANRLEMLAALLADLASGAAAGRWYWQRWVHLFALSTSRALYSVLAENLTQLNGLVEILALHQQLEIVWRNLAEEEAKQLINELSWKNGYSFSEQGIKTSDDAAPVHVPDRILQRWQDVLTPDLTSNRFRLATLLIAQECASLALIKRADLTLSAIGVFLEKLQHTDQSSPKRHGQEESTSAKSTPEIFHVISEMTAPSPETSIHHDQVHPSEPQLPDDSQPEFVKESYGSVGEEETQEKTRKSPEGVIPFPGGREPEHRPESPIRMASETSPPAPHPLNLIHIQTKPKTTISQQFITEQGGVVYLLNFLNRPPLQTIMGDHWQQLPSGWIWLYRVAELLNFNEQDPMALFLAEQIGLETCDDLAKLPTLPERKQIETLAEQWYGKAGVWQPSLLSLPARISYNASHIDMHSALSNVRLDLRLTGLDVNPGWLPWLGRVVQFHFDQHGGLHHE